MKKRLLIVESDASIPRQIEGALPGDFEVLSVRSVAAWIVAVADTFDALTSARVYKEAYEPEVTKLMMENEVGSHFDPDVMAAFRARYPDILGLRSGGGSKRELVASMSASIDARR